MKESFENKAKIPLIQRIEGKSLALVPINHSSLFFISLALLPFFGETVNY